MSSHPPDAEAVLAQRPREAAVLEETLRTWIGSEEQADARTLSSRRDDVSRKTGLSSGAGGEMARALFSRIAARVTRHLGVPVCLFSLIEGPCQVIVASAGAPVPPELPSETSLCVHVRDSGRDLVLDDLSRSLFADVADNATSAGVGSYLGTPVFSPAGEPIGSLCAIDFATRSWEANDLTVLKALAEAITDMIALLQAKRA